MPNICDAINRRAEEAYEAVRDLPEDSQQLMRGRAMGLEEAAAIYLRERVNDDASG